MEPESFITIRACNVIRAPTTAMYGSQTTIIHKRVYCGPYLEHKVWFDQIHSLISHEYAKRFPKTKGIKIALDRHPQLSKDEDLKCSLDCPKQT